MRKKKDIISEHKNILNIIKTHNKRYFVDDKPVISDSEYDKIKISALELEKKYSFLKNNETTGDIIGSKPSNKFKKIKHLSPMLSLANAFDIDDIKDFLKKIKNFLITYTHICTGSIYHTSGPLSLPPPTPSTLLLLPEDLSVPEDGLPLLPLLPLR